MVRKSIFEVSLQFHSKPGSINLLNICKISKNNINFFLNFLKNVQFVNNNNNNINEFVHTNKQNTIFRCKNGQKRHFRYF